MHSMIHTSTLILDQSMVLNTDGSDLSTSSEKKVILPCSFIRISSRTGPRGPQGTSTVFVVSLVAMPLPGLALLSNFNVELSPRQLGAKLSRWTKGRFLTRDVNTVGLASISTPFQPKQYSKKRVFDQCLPSNAPSSTKVLFTTPLKRSSYSVLSSPNWDRSHLFCPK